MENENNKETNNALTIKNLNVEDHANCTLLKNVSGYVRSRGITAVIGPSASGKTLLLKTLAGLNGSLKISGDAHYLGDSVNFRKSQKGMRFVPKEDCLIGDLTTIESLLYSIRLRTNLNKDEARLQAEETLKRLGIYHARDTIIGTIIKKGLSGGEKRRLSVGVEFVVVPSFLLLDEPTSGLDTTSAISLVREIHETVKSNDQLLEGVMLSIHQPNLELLELFDDILVLGRGGVTYFGPVQDSYLYFEKIGFPVPPGHTPTDFILEVTSVSGKSVGKDFDFLCAFEQSSEKAAVMNILQQHTKTSKPKLLKTVADEAGFWRKFYWIAQREFVLAKRDVTLYWFQTAMNLMFGFLIGTTFWNMPYVIDSSMGQVSGGLLWLLMLLSYIHIFKATYLAQAESRAALEMSNGAYNSITYYFADMFCVSFLNIYQWLGCILGYFMMGFPASAFGDVLLICYVMAVTAESLTKLISKVSPNTATTVVIVQCVVIAMNVFPPGLVITKDHVPVWWEWAGELSLFVRSHECMLAAVYDHITFDCPTEQIDSSTESCLNSGVGTGIFPCDVFETSEDGTFTCQLDGRSALEYQTGFSRDKDQWELFGYLVLYYVCLRLLVLALNDVNVPEVLGSWAKRIIGSCSRPKAEQGAGPSANVTPAEQNKGTKVQRFRTESSYKGNASTQEGSSRQKEARARFRTESSFKGSEYMLADEVADLEDGAPKSIARSQEVQSFKGFKSKLLFEDVVVTLRSKDRKVLNDNVTAVAEAGRPLFLMGPSGAGKTTLLNALAARVSYADVSGKILYNGKSIVREQLAYVEQFDELLHTFTVREHFTYRGLLMGVQKEVLDKRVPELLEILGFENSNKSDSRTDKLTSGQLKRVSIGIGMISDPDVLFLDEPTTGLDSASSYSVMHYISDLAHHTGTVTISTLHQPSKSVFDLCKDLLLLEKGGKVAYFGDTVGCLDYFETIGCPLPEQMNPADFYLNLIYEAPVAVGHLDSGSWSELYRTNQPKSITERIQILSDSKNVIDSETPLKTTTLQKLSVVIKKTFVFYKREAHTFPVRAVELSIFALFLGTVFLRIPHKSTWLLEFSGAFFFSIWCGGFACLSATPTHVVVRRQVVQEHLAGAYPLWMSCISQFLVGIMFNGVIGFLYQVILHYLVGFNDNFEVFGFMVLLTIQLLLLFDGVNICMAEILKHDVLAITAGMVFMGTFMLYAGYFVKVEDMPPVLGTWLPYMLPLRYFIAGAINNIVGSIEIFNPDYEIYLDSDYVIEEIYRMPQANKWNFFAINFAWIILLRMGQYALSRFNVRVYNKH